MKLFFPIFHEKILGIIHFFNFLKKTLVKVSIVSATPRIPGVDGRNYLVFPLLNINFMQL